MVVVASEEVGGADLELRTHHRIHLVWTRTYPFADIRSSHQKGSGRRRESSIMSMDGGSPEMSPAVMDSSSLRARNGREREGGREEFTEKRVKKKGIRGCVI